MKLLKIQNNCKFSQLYDISQSLCNVSPLDGRYAKSTLRLRDYFSEYALNKYRTKVEIEWIKFLCQKNMVRDGNNTLINLSDQQINSLNSIYLNFTLTSAERVKQIEQKTNHDVKAVEYFIKEQLDQCGDLQFLKEYVHLLCTSEDINNLSYSLMLKESKDNLILQEINSIIQKMANFSETTASIPMLSRTHGQTASPTTVGKEIANFTYRINKQSQLISQLKFPGKLNGAVGNFNAHIFSYPNENWYEMSQQFIKSLGLEFNPFTTQIESHDEIALYYSYLQIMNTILIGFCRDMWSYISIGYFKQKSIKSEVGSSTMPHKTNPIDFENCEGSLGLSNSLGQHFINKLPISRFQRDLSDSTVMRNHGVALGYSLVGWKSLEKGMNRIEPNQNNLLSDLDKHWEVLAEPIQQVMRKYNMENPYERLKDITRGAIVEQNSLRDFIQSLELPESDKRRLLQLEPKDYIGNADIMAQKIRNYL